MTSMGAGGVCTGGGIISNALQSFVLGEEMMVNPHVPTITRRRNATDLIMTAGKRGINGRNRIN
jgi:hypothetical protein